MTETSCSPATERLLTLLYGVRSRGNNRWMARCPAHEDRSPSLMIRQTQDRALIRCWAGCEAKEIVAAVGLTLADLYDRRSKPDPGAQRRRRAAGGLETWRQTELQRCAEDLQTRDTIIRIIDRVVEDGVLTQDEAMISLAHEYDGYSGLENRFERLIRNQDTLQLWRESRAA